MKGAVREAEILAVVALGGVLGAEARYGLGLLWPTPVASFPWTTLLVNALGCLVIGVFLVAITEGRPAHRLLRPFFGTGVLGGFTTFSTYCLDLHRLFEAHQPGLAVGYLAGTLAAALGAVGLGAAGTRRLLAVRRAGGAAA
nr:CrcB family protein [Streptomyces tateyamensis]